VDAPIGALQFTGHEYGAILSHYTTIDSRVTYSYSFVTMSWDGNWQAEEIPLIPAETFAEVVSFDWYGAGFGLFWTQPEDDGRRLGYLQIGCER
jgi:hypothetical protein